MGKFPFEQNFIHYPLPKNYKDSSSNDINTVHLPKNIAKYLIIIGLILIIAGIIFTMQSKSIVGPSSSFMYQNPEWTINGYVIITIGIIISVFGIVVWQSGTKKSSIDK